MISAPLAAVGRAEFRRDCTQRCFPGGPIAAAVPHNQLGCIRVIDHPVMLLTHIDLVDWPVAILRQSPLFQKIFYPRSQRGSVARGYDALWLASRKIEVNGVEAESISLGSLPVHSREELLGAG